ncbi:MAG: purine-binding chemotaxis protein CheW [Gammaproteobacteria bacterium]|nr:MAG: purine-binding chemotaxis protein CheW [Gammaproteobacteria bacterium]
MTTATTEKPSPYRLLAELEQRCRDCAAGLPEQEEVVELWNGVGFTLGGQRFVAPMGEVSEILHVPRATQVPGVKPWMYGVANVRGRLLPMIRLPEFLGLPTTARTRRDQRVLVVEYGDIFSGLIVDDVLGMQYFPVDSFSPKAQDAPGPTQPFLRGDYTRSDERWHVFSTFALVESQAFMDIATW